MPLFQKTKRRPPPGDYPGDWRPPLQGRPPRRYGLLITALLSVCAAAAMAWWLVQDFRATGGPPAEVTAKPSQPADGASRSGQPPAAVPARDRSDRILRCLAEDGSVFYTNALSCAAADLENRVNVVPAAGAQPGPPATECLGLADPPRAQQFLSGCQQPFNQALKLEPALARAADPASSPRLVEYCELITAGVNAGCMATNATFCYLPLCQQLREKP